MGYYEFTITVADESRDALLERMSQAGCLGVVETDSTLIAYFTDLTGIDSILDDLGCSRSVLEEAGLPSGFTFEYVFLSERDWNESWKKKFEPILVGENLSVVPPWDTSDTGRMTLIIDPGMAFGTGHHETTKNCLALIERLAGEVNRGAFLDVGTGTGILAIAASKLGFEQVVGVDIDPLALSAAHRNIASNRLVNIQIREGSLSSAEGLFDMIAANILKEVLLGMAPGIAARLKRPGTALLSGMLTGQEDEVIAAVEREGLRCREKIVDGRWVSLIVSH
ncbi:MAG: 50S ribosomal protein L11 methyltransferase [Alphaproteobacteria bacterium]|uniref:Ribosomal protein L11 methyltransferase n=1 Tax=Candidatus Nitrobium versatile TaxID=2884831 RepID=A0A953J7D8_9BACT|nr:50S ribosomal protein L11 methyltransferase [Candidatus Nitrobium versatile]